MAAAATPPRDPDDAWITSAGSALAATLRRLGTLGGKLQDRTGQVNATGTGGERGGRSYTTSRRAERGTSAGSALAATLRRLGTLGGRHRAAQVRYFSGKEGKNEAKRAT